MIVVAGGTGRLGRLVVASLLADGHAVRVLARGLVPDPGLVEQGAALVTADVRDTSSLAAAVAGADAVVSAVQGLAGKGRVTPGAVDRDGNAHLVDAAAAAGADMVLLSIVGAGHDHPMGLFRMKAAAEDRLTARGLAWTVVRATAFAELHLELLRGTAGRSGRPLVLGRGQNPINFVSVADVAAVVCRAATDAETRNRVVEVGGPANLTMTELAAVAQRQLGTQDKRPRHLPRAVLRAVAGAGRVTPSQPTRLAANALLMDTADLTFDAPSLLPFDIGRPGTDVRTLELDGAAPTSR